MSFIFLGVSATTVGIATAATAGGVMAYTQYQSDKTQQAMADYSADIAENEAIAKQQAIEAESRRLSRGQREMKAQQRVSITGRGGLAEGTDLLALAESARDMQLDQLELQRQQGIAGTHGASSAAMYRYQGEQAASPYKWLTAGARGAVGGASAGAAGAKAYQNWKAER